MRLYWCVFKYTTIISFTPQISLYKTKQNSTPLANAFTAHCFTFAIALYMSSQLRTPFQKTVRISFDEEYPFFNRSQKIRLKHKVCNCTQKHGPVSLRTFIAVLSPPRWFQIKLRAAPFCM